MKVIGYIIVFNYYEQKENILEMIVKWRKCLFQMLMISLM